MAFERAPFGSVTLGNVVDDVSTHFGVRPTGGEDGKLQSAGAEREAVVNFDESDTPLYIDNFIPAGAVVTQIFDAGATGAVATATVGAQDISAADGTEANYVLITTSAALTVTGPTAGSVVVKYTKVA